MLVVHIITGLSIGGAESMLLRLLRALGSEPAKHLVLVLSSKDALKAEFEAAGVRVISLGEGGKGIIGSLWRARALIKAERPSMMMTWLHHADLFGVMLKCFFPKLPLIWNIRCSILEASHLPRRNLIMVSVLAKVSSVPTAIVANSGAGMQAHIDAGYRTEGWRIFPNGFDVERFCPNEVWGQRMRRELGIDHDAYVVGMVSRYHPMKGFDLFVHAAARIASTLPKARFVMVGSEVDWSNRELSGWIEANGLREQFFLLGPRRDMPQMMNLFDILVSSSSSEGFPNVIGEAMACGTLCVATDVGDSAHLIGATGKIVPFGSAQALADAVLELCLMPQAKQMIMRDAARRRIVEEFSINSISTRYQELFNEFED